MKNKFSSPSPRLKNLKCVFSARWDSLILISALAFLCALPFWAWYVLGYITDAQIMAEYSALSAAEQREAVSRLFSNQALFGLLLLPVSFLTGALLCGAVSASVKLLWGEQDGKVRDFFQGVKALWLRGGLAGLACGVTVDIANLLKWGNGVWFTVASFALLVLLVLLFLPVAVIFLYASFIYRGKAIKALKNAFIIYFAKLFKTCGVYLLASAPVLVVFIFNMHVWAYAFVFIEGVYLFGATAALVGAYNLYLFDEYVNKQNYPELYMKGLGAE